MKLAFIAALVGRCALAATSPYFAIEVVDEQTGRGVPLVELRTVNNISHWTDSAGLVAFNEPGLMGEEVFFHIQSPGYEYPKDFFNNRGVRLRPKAGGAAQIKIKRTQIAERLYRITGGGIYRDSELLARKMPLKNPNLNGQVMGQDTVIVAPYRNKLYWFWGDTERASYPLGNFGASGATSEFPSRGGLDPSIGIDLTYFVNKDGFSKPMCPDSEFGEGLKWIEGVSTLTNSAGKEQLVARVAAGTGLKETREWHLALFNDQKEIFESVVKWPINEGHDSSHPFQLDGYLYLFPDFRVRANLDAMRNLANYEAHTFLNSNGEPQRNANGSLRYSWQRGGERLRGNKLSGLIKDGSVKPEETHLYSRDIETGRMIQFHRGSVAWNEFRKRWIMIFSADPGEIWYSESNQPTGPWRNARRIAVHGQYNFYNPVHHPFFDQEGGRAIYFQGTYTEAFSAARAKTPRYDYNQIMYRLRLDDPRLTLADHNLEPGMRHLRSLGEPEWDEYKNSPVHGSRFDIEFESESNATNWTLLLRQRDVKVVWPVQLNGRTITNLFLSEDDLVHAITIPPGALTNGPNKLSITPPKERDDIEVGEIRLIKSMTNGLFNLRVTENGKPSPCRVTVVNSAGSLFPAKVDAPHAAVRPGVAYLGDGIGKFELPIGDYTIYVGRGFEYSVSTQKITIRRDQPLDLKVQLVREVDSHGYVACDTHVHTFTYSRHGDATDEERAITLAGEGIELPIATDHNLVIDPVTPAKNTGMDRYFTPVHGDEATTGHAHFNIFPLPPGSRAPNWRIDHWPDLISGFRTAGAKVVILNHPRNIHNKFQPFASTNFNAKTGQNLRGFEFTFDAVEVVNSSALQTDWMINFTDWMALLNYGYRVTGVGSSDGHDVSRYIIGQGRTYLACDDADPSRINIDAACESLLKGRAFISMGLLPKATNIDDRSLSIEVHGPGWTAVDKIQLFQNGETVKEWTTEPIYKPGLKTRVEFALDKVKKDAHFVVVASGPPVTAPFWRIPKPYQPTSTTWKPRVIGATNPIYVDADRDGKFTPLRLQNQD